MFSGKAQPTPRLKKRAALLSHGSTLVPFDDRELTSTGVHKSPPPPLPPPQNAPVLSEQSPVFPVSSQKRHFQAPPLHTGVCRRPGPGLCHEKSTARTNQERADARAIIVAGDVTCGMGRGNRRAGKRLL